MCGGDHVLTTNWFLLHMQNHAWVYIMLTIITAGVDSETLLLLSTQVHMHANNAVQQTKL